MNDEEHLECGLAMLRQMLGDDEAARIQAGWSNLSPDFERCVLGFLSSQVWTRGNLDVKTRSLCTVAALTALGRQSGLELNVRMALGNGAGREEILEAMLQMAPCAGFPAAWAA